MSLHGLLHRLRGWFPKEPTNQNVIEPKAETTKSPSKKLAYAAYFAIYLSIVYPVLFLADYLGFTLVYKLLAGAAAAALAGALGSLVLKLPWRKKARETLQE